MKYILIALAVFAVACTKTYEPPTIWTVSIKQDGDTLTAVARNTKSTNLTYRWDINGKRTTGISTLLNKGRNDI